MLLTFVRAPERLRESDETSATVVNLRSRTGDVYDLSTAV